MPDNLILTLGFNAQPALNQLDRQLSVFEKRRSLKFNLDTSSLSRATQSFNEFDRVVERTGKHILAFGASIATIELLRRGIENTVRSFVDLDQKLQRININLNTSQANLDRFGKSLFQIARDTGQSFDEVAKAATIFAQQGNSVVETLNRTKAAMILVRQSGVDLEDSIEAITSTITEFKKESLSAIDVANKFASIDGKFATSSKVISEAITKVGESAASSGVDLNHLIAIITSIASTTQQTGPRIGAFLNQLFNNETKQSTIEQFKKLGVQIERAPGQFLPAVNILKNIADKYNEVSSATGKTSDVTRQLIVNLLGGSRNLNLLNAILGDVNKQYGIYAQSLNVVTNSQDAAIKKNDQLNKSFAAQANAAGQSLQQIAAQVGKLTFGPIFDRTIGNFNNFIKVFANSSGGDQGQSIGQKIGEGILKGIGNALAGPGLVIGGALVAKLVGQIGRYTVTAAKDLLSSNNAAEKQEAIQKTISAILKDQNGTYQKLLSLGNNKVEQEKFILDLFKQQNAELIGREALTSSLSTSIYNKGGFSSGGTIKGIASGFLPDEVQAAIGQERAATSANVGGGAGANPVVVDNFSIGGQKQTIVANDKEFFVPTRSINPSYNGPDQVSIVNPEMVSAMGGLPHGAIPIRAKGHIPHKALGNIPYDFASYGTSVISSILPYLLGGASAIGLGGIGTSIAKSLFGGKEGEFRNGFSGGDFYAKNIAQDLLGPTAIKRRTKRGLIQTGRAFGLDVEELKQLTKGQIANRLNTEVLQQYPQLYHSFIKRGYVGNDDLTDTLEGNFNILKNLGVHASGYVPQNFAFGSTDLYKQGRSILRNAKNYHTYDDAVSALPQFKKNLKEYLHSRNPSQINAAHKLIEKLKSAGFGIEYDKDLFPVQTSKDILSEGRNLLGYTKNYEDYGNAKKVFPYFASNLQNYINNKNPNKRDAQSIYNLLANLRKSGFGIEYSGGPLENLLGDFSSGVGINVDTGRGTKKQQAYQKKLLSYMKLGMSETQAADQIVNESYSEKRINSYQRNQRNSLASQYFDEFPDFAHGFVPSAAVGFGPLIGSGISRSVYGAGEDNVVSIPHTSQKFAQSIDERHSPSAASELKSPAEFTSRLDQSRGLRVLQQIAGEKLGGPEVIKVGKRGSYISKRIFAPTLSELIDGGNLEAALFSDKYRGLQEKYNVSDQDAHFGNIAGNVNTGTFHPLDFGELYAKNSYGSIVGGIKGKIQAIRNLSKNDPRLRKKLNAASKKLGLGLSFAGGFFPDDPEAKALRGLYNGPDDFARQLKLEGHDENYITEQLYRYYGVGKDISTGSGFSLPQDALNALSNINLNPAPTPPISSGNIPVTPPVPPPVVASIPKAVPAFTPRAIAPPKPINFSPILLQEAAKIPALHQFKDSKLPLDLGDIQSDEDLKNLILDHYRISNQQPPASIISFGQTSSLDQGKISAVKKTFNVNDLDLLQANNQRARLFNNKGGIAPSILDKVKTQLQTNNTRFGNILNDKQIEDLATEIITTRLADFDKEAIKQLQNVKITREKLNEKVKKSNTNVLANEIQNAISNLTPLTQDQENRFLKQNRADFYSGLSPQQRRDPKIRELAEQIAQQELGIVTGQITQSRNQRQFGINNVDFTNSFINKYSGFFGGSNGQKASKEIEDFVEKQKLLGGDEQTIRNQISNVQQEASQRASSVRNQRALGIAFAAPLISSTIAQTLIPEKSERTRDTFNGVTNSLSTGGTIAAIGGFTPLSLGIAGAVTAIGLFQTALENIGPSVKRANEAYQKGADRENERAQLIKSYIDSVAHVKDVIDDGGNTTQIKTAQNFQDQALNNLPVSLRTQFLGKNLDQLNNFAIQDSINAQNRQLKFEGNRVFADLANTNVSQGRKFDFIHLFKDSPNDPAQFNNPFTGDTGQDKLNDTVKILQGYGIKSSNINEGFRNSPILQKALGKTNFNILSQFSNEAAANLKIALASSEKLSQAENKAADALVEQEKLTNDLNREITRSINRGIFQNTFAAQGNFNIQENRIKEFGGLFDAQSDTFTPQLNLNTKSALAAASIRNQGQLEASQAIAPGLEQLAGIFSNRSGKETKGDNSTAQGFGANLISGLRDGSLTSRQGIEQLQKIADSLQGDNASEIQEQVKDIVQKSQETLASIDQKTQQALAQNDIQTKIEQKILDLQTSRAFAGGIDTFTDPNKFNQISAPIITGLTSLIARGQFNQPLQATARRLNALTPESQIALTQQINERNAGFGRSNLALKNVLTELGGNDSSFNDQINQVTGGRDQFLQDLISQRKNQFGSVGSSLINSGFANLQGGDFSTAQFRLQREVSAGANNLDFSNVLKDLNGLRSNSTRPGNQRTFDNLIGIFDTLNREIAKVASSSGAQADVEFKTGKFSPAQQSQLDAIKFANSDTGKLVQSNTNLVLSLDTLDNTLKQINNINQSSGSAIGGASFTSSNNGINGITDYGATSGASIATPNGVQSSSLPSLIIRPDLLNNDRLSAQQQITNLTSLQGTRLSASTLAPIVQNIRQTEASLKKDSGGNLLDKDSDLINKLEQLINSLTGNSKVYNVNDVKQPSQVGVDAKVSIAMNVAGNISNGVNSQEFQNIIMAATKKAIDMYVKPGAINKSAPPLASTINQNTINQFGGF